MGKLIHREVYLTPCATYTLATRQGWSATPLHSIYSCPLTSSAVCEHLVAEVRRVNRVDTGISYDTQTLPH
jgi:hypothetical protein